MRNFPLLLAVLATIFASVNAEADPRYVCSFCLIALGLVEQSAFQVHLESALVEKCGDHKLCQRMVKELVLSVEGKAVPEDLCKEMTLCTEDCKLFAEWPVNPLPPQPPAWPIEVSNTIGKKCSAFAGSCQVDKDCCWDQLNPMYCQPETHTCREMMQSHVSEDIMKGTVPRDLSILKPVFEKLMIPLPSEWGMWAHVTVSMASLFYGLNHTIPEHRHGNNGVVPASHHSAYPEACGYNISCHIQAIIDHKPIQDHDGDYYSMEEVRRLRGTDWRGVDCNDKDGGVYPGRKTTAYGAEIDHNCNGIAGANETGKYEDMFCRDYQPRGNRLFLSSSSFHLSSSFRRYCYSW
jgi:hypothetical protein